MRYSDLRPGPKPTATGSGARLRRGRPAPAGGATARIDDAPGVCLVDSLSRAALDATAGDSHRETFLSLRDRHGARLVYGE
jgi:hypothetical protein